MRAELVCCAAVSALCAAASGGCGPAPADGGVSFGITLADHDRLYYPADVDDDAALTKTGDCGSVTPCAALTGSHQCSSTDVTNAFLRPFCQASDPFQGALPKAQGAYACAQCHGATGSFRVERCAECHLKIPIVPPGDPRAPAGAKSPDERHRHAAGFAVDTPTCASCHADDFDTNRDGRFDRNDQSSDNADRVAGHLPFAIGPGAAHYRLACAECHAATRTDKPWALDFTRATCASCHFADDVQAIHTDDGTPRVPGYVDADEARCLDCHADGAAR